VTVTEHSLETYRFSCTYCTHDWQQDYRRRETRERDGTEWIVHYWDGAPAENPTAAVFQCPGCGHNTIAVRRVAHHPLPAQTPWS
jgi:transcription elongation factor Elf1